MKKLTLHFTLLITLITSFTACNEKVTPPGAGQCKFVIQYVFLGTINYVAIDANGPNTWIYPTNIGSSFFGQVTFTLEAGKTYHVMSDRGGPIIQTPYPTVTAENFQCISGDTEWVKDGYVSKTFVY